MKKISFAGFLSILLSLLTVVGCRTKNNEVRTDGTPNSEALTRISDSIPLPEHPRPDFQRPDWANLNGQWQFEFDSTNGGEARGWSGGKQEFTKRITVPFPWGSPLSGVKDEAEIAWYQRTVTVPPAWKGKRVYLVVGASDWITTGWLDGKQVGRYQGGYTPFEFELTDHVRFGEPQRLVVKVDDTPFAFKLYGKQGYGDAKGIWQTVYLEARAPVSLDYVHFSPDIDRQSVRVAVGLNRAPAAKATFTLRIKGGKNPEIKQAVAPGQQRLDFTVAIPNAHLWSLEDPYLYEATATLADQDDNEDQVATYFGMRKISVTNLPGTDIPYVALNNKPIYLQLALDQAYHPEGYYTFPSDQFMKDEILRTKRIGLNGQRIHIKVEHPRKLYWADKLGVLIMADVPNSWGEPGPLMRKELEVALRGMVKRDYNHPAIFSWIDFNETWGLFTKGKDNKRAYRDSTQKWVGDMYRLTKSLDATRLVEDNSPCNFDHVDTDINSWHAYLPGYEWKKALDEYSRKTFPGSNWNFVKGYVQKNQPMINSECGNVWGYEGSTGDVDWSWDYHLMMNEFRSHPKVAGWLYTEHHDVVNEWNGYYRFDRSLKFTGLDSLAPGMRLNDLHSAVYLAPQLELCKAVRPGAEVTIPLWLSVMTDQHQTTRATLETELVLWDRLGNEKRVSTGNHPDIVLQPWASKLLDPIVVKMPPQPGLAILRTKLKDERGKVLQHNFTTFLVGNGPSPRDEKISENGESRRVLRFAPASFTKAEWTQKQWNVLQGLKVNGAGAGYFEYAVDLPRDLDLATVQEVYLRLEASAKALLGKDKAKPKEFNGDYMRGAGLHDPGKNVNAYPMTDEKRFPSRVRIRVNGKEVAVRELPDDPADHRGILSWHAQPKNRTLHEAGSFGYLITANIPPDVLREAGKRGKLIIRLEVDAALPGGLAVYGERFGRYPIDPMIVMKLNDKAVEKGGISQVINP
ncbi:MAG: glycoside hydrolase family 2 [Ferruginibacter sp.]|nr:glycoside hydrolase family 2 [Cytophagales bacterium]